MSSCHHLDIVIITYLNIRQNYIYFFLVIIFGPEYAYFERFALVCVQILRVRCNRERLHKVKIQHTVDTNSLNRCR